MAKIWEVNFTSFSGGGDTAFDNVGTQHLTTHSGIVKVNPLSGFTYRGGVGFTQDNVLQRYGVRSAGATNGCFNGSYTTRSFVMWLYNNGLFSSGTFWDSAATVCSIWSEFNTGPSIQSGFFKNNSNAVIRFHTTGGASISGPEGLPVGWNLLVATVNKTTNSVNFYVNSVLVGTITTVTSNTGGTLDCFIGDYDVLGEGSFQVGYVATYDHILSQAEVDTIYSTFLVDSAVDAPYQSLSGTIYDFNGLPVGTSGARVFAIHDSTNQIVNDDYTTSSGTYALNLPYSGAYSIVATSNPNPGSRCISVAATSSGVFPI